MYPMFNEKSMDVASFLSTIILKSPEDMEKYFPLYKVINYYIYIFSNKSTFIYYNLNYYYSMLQRWLLLLNQEMF